MMFPRFHGLTGEESGVQWRWVSRTVEVSSSRERSGVGCGSLRCVADAPGGGGFTQDLDFVLQLGDSLLGGLERGRLDAAGLATSSPRSIRS
jgi:hypothetical protein